MKPWGTFSTNAGSHIRVHVTAYNLVKNRCYLYQMPVEKREQLKITGFKIGGTGKY